MQNVPLLTKAFTVFEIDSYKKKFDDMRLPLIRPMSSGYPGMEALGF